MGSPLKVLALQLPVGMPKRNQSAQCFVSSNQGQNQTYRKSQCNRRITFTVFHHGSIKCQMTLVCFDFHCFDIPPATHLPDSTKYPHILRDIFAMGDDEFSSSNCLSISFCMPSIKLFVISLLHGLMVAYRFRIQYYRFVHEERIDVIAIVPRE